MTVGDEVNFVFFAPSVWNSFWKAINFADLFLHLSQIMWLIICLQWSMLPVEMCFTIYSPCKSRSVVSETPTGLKVNDSNKLLIELTGAIV